MADSNKFVQHLSENYFIPNSVLVDCTADSHIVSHYYDWLQRGIHVVTPNKKANSGPLDQLLLELDYQSLAPYVVFLKLETKFCGLRVFLGCGTLSYIFNNFTGTKAFSQVVKEAKEAGYTEPDPRDDLSGTDVSRKILTDIGFKCFRSLLSSVNLTEDLILFLFVQCLMSRGSVLYYVIILARESGLDLELSDIPVQSLVPEPLRATASADDFLHDLPKFDEELSKQRQVAEDEGEVLRYVGVVDVVNGKGLLN
ncbi:Bifunctional aspartokinase/homoserine dehydrogenase 1, chloroplastic [Capsicum baccatum]|uniref:Homoserine dehydrogenase n=1 Tax=Capsicum baccatum TaxID=33114 RepID=A0A2G2VM09_CAPBA|nr:Bifunctional aspartokinase/homoserine dehydrogenase 1, chloroplastic [Capsicum baccatum]